MPLFDGNLTRERIREAELRLEHLKVVQAQVRQAIELDVRRALLTLQSGAEELRSADAVIAEAQEGLRIATVRFEAGVSTNLEAISAQASLAQAEVNKVQALFNFNLARAQLGSDEVLRQHSGRPGPAGTPGAGERSLGAVLP